MSNFSWVYFLKTKDQTFSTFRNFKSMVEREFDNKIRFIRSDGGGEYCSREFDSYLASEGIQRQLTVAKTPQQNGLSERLNRTIMNGCRTLLIESALPYQFWAEAVATTVYVKNRGYSRSIIGRTSYEALMGVKPDVGYLRTFGSLCYYRIPKDERGKLEPNGKRAIFLGYCIDRRGYRLYDQMKDKVIISRDVVFQEAKLGYDPNFVSANGKIAHVSNVNFFDFFG